MQWKFTTWNGTLIIGSVLNLFSITYLGTLLEGSFIDSLPGLLTLRGPLKARFLVVVLENGHEAAAFLQAPLCFRGTEGLCSVTSRSLFLPQINPDVLNQLGCGCLSCLDWEEAGGRWEPHHQKTGWLFRPPVSSSSGVQEAWIRWSWD